MSLGANSGTYSFANIVAALTGPSGSFPIGSSAGSAEEGISYRMIEDKTTTTTGAGGDIMHSLHASQTGEIIIRLLKTSPVNAQFSALYATEKTTSGLWGQDTITIQDVVRGDVITGQQMAFIKFPDGGFSKEGPPTQEWAFRGIIDIQLGTGTPSH
jgi:hypothetical protein